MADTQMMETTFLFHPKQNLWKFFLRSMIYINHHNCTVTTLYCKTINKITTYDISSLVNDREQRHVEVLQET